MRGKAAGFHSNSTHVLHSIWSRGAGTQLRTGERILAICWQNTDVPKRKSCVRSRGMLALIVSVLVGIFSYTCFANDEEDFQVNTPVQKLRMCDLLGLNLYNPASVDFADATTLGVVLAYINTPKQGWMAGVGYSTKWQAIKDSNGNLELVTTTGQSGTTPPMWATMVGQTTVDGTVGWINEGPFDARNPPAGLKRSIAFLSGSLNSGKLDVESAPSIIRNLALYSSSNCPTLGPIGGSFDDNRVTIIHFLRWGDSAHTSVKFQNWYVFDPSGTPVRRFTLTSAQNQFEGTVIGFGPNPVEN